MKRLLRADQTLFRDPDVFDFASMPDHLHHRDAQVKELTFLLRDPPGAGKTTTVRRVFSAFGEETRQVVPVYVNCRPLSCDGKGGICR